ncbi:MAG TPA: undecaprenyl-diphosphate phosphatase [Acidimicrobiia bacterium]|nr:undecaprenyl-diphosphate phosphatase [Acidimicrobiia bacterium]
MLSYFQAVVIGLLQGVTELFPVSSLGHSVLVPGLLGWNNLVGAQSADESFYLAFLVGLHVATALALLVYFRNDWIRIIRGMLGSLKTRRIDNSDARLGWLLVIATIPVGVTGLLFEHSLRTVFAKPLAAGLFLFLNGLILLGGERLRRKAERRVAAPVPALVGADGTAGTGAPGLALDTLGPKDAVGIGAFQILALFAGVSRSGVTMTAGLLRGLDHEDAARFSFLLATPIILAAGVYKLPDLLGPLGDGIRGQMLVGSIFAGLASYAAVRFLVRWFTTRTLTPFGIYCLVGGALAVLRFH